MDLFNQFIRETFVTRNREGSTMPRKPLFTQYTAKNGATQYKPSIEYVMALSHDGMGFCLACTEAVDGIEPDAGKYTCPSCGAAKVYGAEQLALMGLTF